MAHRGVPLEVVHYLAENGWRPPGDYAHVNTACGLTVTRMMATTIITLVECSECILIEHSPRPGRRHPGVPCPAVSPERDIPE
jgi:hypothetical protein